MNISTSGDFLESETSKSTTSKSVGGIRIAVVTPLWCQQTPPFTPQSIPMVRKECSWSGIWQSKHRCLGCATIILFLYAFPNPRHYWYGHWISARSITMPIWTLFCWLTLPRNHWIIVGKPLQSFGLNRGNPSYCHSWRIYCTCVINIRGRTS